MIAAQRRSIELATLKRKLEARFFERKVAPGKSLEEFLGELDIILQELHYTKRLRDNAQKSKSTINQMQHVQLDDIFNYIRLNTSQSSVPLISIKKKTKKKKINYNRLIKRLNYKFRRSNIILRKTDKSKIFHLGKKRDYESKSNDYMVKTNAYICRGDNNPLNDLNNRTNKYLLELRLKHLINQKQYEKLCMKPDDAELAHLYYLPKVHKLNTPLSVLVHLKIYLALFRLVRSN